MITENNKQKRRVLFVGVHNKPGLEPLDCNSRSGWRIQMAIDKIKGADEIIKTNLFNSYTIPNEKADIILHGQNWFSRYQPNNGDVIILLGLTVKDYFPPYDGIVIEYRHPSPMFSKKSDSQYAEDLSDKINEALIKSIKCNR